MLELKKIYRIDAVFTDYKYTFQLTLNDYASSWIIRCDTEFDMKLWMRAIKQRKTRYPTGGDKTPLLARRNKKLAPIMTQSTHQPLFTSSSSSYSSSISSSTSSQFSPLTTRAPPLYDQCAFKAIKEAQPSAYNNKLSIQSHTEIEDDELSPTYLLYKKKFRL
ncbi:hypothetical protein BY458DRAFT_500406 [Sporodiniella umbellata]|nr:hypothetical protein BY458DRAFT_500406 [Sporodiniella umbellata]